MDRSRIKELYNVVIDRIERNHIAYFEGMDKPLFLVSTQYPGIWMEHLYDSVLYAKMFPERLAVAINAINIFMKNQRADGQLPCYIWNKKFFPGKTQEDITGYGQIQECVSVGALFLEVAQMSGDNELLERCYESVKAWVNWLKVNRMTTKRGLIELFCGYDTGHDNSGRFPGLVLKGNYEELDGIPHNASEPYPSDPIAPLLAVDMNCNFYGDNIALSLMAEALNKPEEAKLHRENAMAVKEKMFELCLDDDGFFYDVDKNGNKIKCRSCTIFHLFLEGVLDINEDKAVIDRLYSEYISNPNEFMTPYPFPSVSVSDPSFKKHTDRNCWGYFSQALIAFRTTRWMEKYGYTEDYECLLKTWVTQWTKYYDDIKFAQELDPLTGVPSRSSEWYSSCMLLYIFAVRRLGLLADN